VNVDGLNLYRGYFVPNGLDPSGLDDIFVNPEGEQFAGLLPDGAVVWAVSPEGTSGIPMWTMVGTVDPQDASRVRLSGSQGSVSLATLGQMADQFASGTDAAALERIHHAIGSVHALETLAQRIAALDDQQCLEGDDDLVAQYRNLRQIGQDEAVRELRQLRNELAMNMVPTGAIAGKMMAVVGMVGGKIGTITAAGVSKVLLNSTRQLQAKFKHAADFGITGQANKQNLSLYGAALNQHVNAPGVKAIQGTYRGSPVIHHLDSATGLNVMSDLDGNFISGWKLNPAQLQNVLTRGSL
jgi:hypothetical protein